MKIQLFKFFYQINVWQSMVVVCLLSSPWFVYIFMIPDNHTKALLWAYTALTYFLLSFLLYIFLRLISNLGKTPIRKKIVTFTRIFIRFHVAMAILGVISILFHIVHMLNGGWGRTLQGTSGFLAVCALIPLLVTGYLRKKKSSGKRRRFHRYSAYISFIFILIHILF
ncbi:hypothetical protein [Pseudalkalibacillus salsuginis]|uniref:hypothetical protein n=1 Tax=Pseudalkalibacillus salsuginis TaxID=2910972 RepID=UPI001F1E8559|nr:hypothetical protein [Pseudalkalibacillus salsuginis]MCF6411771.1 hypothetical protein [Pseudalkalibacillus salsuginis]